MAERDFPVIGIGASAGGLEALRALFGGASELTGMAFVVVQHLDPTHESLMAQLIERYTDMEVSQATGGEIVEPDHIYVIPPAHGLALKDGVLELTEFKDPRGMRRPIDDFFESLAQDRESNAACVILSGTGGDGSRGLRAIKEHGGLCVAQDPESAGYDGMPSSAIATGLVDIVAAPRQIIEALHNFFDRSSGVAGKVDEAREVTDHIDDLCDVLRKAVGHDFSRYKRSTLTRRIARRMQLLGLDSAAEYLERLRSDEDECTALFRDLLINVTRFFRDTAQYEALSTLVVDRLVKQTRDEEELRIWVPGCSSGEEAYSIAMLFAEAAQRQSKRPYIQIFATDIDDGMLDIARGGAYPLSALSDIPQPLQERYTIGGSDKFHIASNIRDMVRFSVHNVVRDPPFSKIDLVSCRNLLIYFDESLQRSVIPLFHFSLAERGMLFLGSSEAIGRFDDLFETIDQNSRIFRRKEVKGKYTLQIGKDGPVGPRPRRKPEFSKDPSPTEGNEIAALKTIARRYAPVSLLVDNEGMLMERWGAAGRYLDFPDRLERNVVVSSLARPGLRELIGPMIRQVADEARGRRVGAKNILVRTEFGEVETRIVCEKIDHGSFLFIIEETGELQPVDQADLIDFDMEHGQQHFLEEELQATRHRLRSTVEELETTNEELKSSNEEMMSMNEELQSTNEELTTVNDELKNKVDQLTMANSDLKNFFDSTQLAVLVVDGELRLRSFTDAARDLFPIDKQQIGSNLGSLPNAFADDEFVELARLASSGGETREARVHSNSLEAEFIIRAFPYRRLDGELDGATLVFTDVTRALSLESELREERERLRLALEVARIGVWEYEPSTDITVLDETERQLLNMKEGEAGDQMQPILDNLPEEDRARVNQSLRQAMDGTRPFDERFRVPLDNGDYRWLHGLGRRIDNGQTNKFIGVTIDITAERSLLEQRELMIREMNHRVKNLFSVISAMVSIAAREAEEVEEFAEDIRDRIHALGRSHSLTNDSAVGGAGAVPLRSLIETVVNPSKSTQDIHLMGEDVDVPNSQITSLALILHEWATNAAKYGALSVEDGCLEVDWAVEENRLTLDWREKGLGKKAGGGKAGFGTRLIETATRQLKGDIEGEPTDEGYTRRLRFTPDLPQL
ncbi:chemotaxis protein CheB [Qipengyuania vesicularis]|uniref:chemotaxis protein CheB n=1 Tax=Qipengyuania vesicularis TaxID=2867232 RepID=UPI001C880C58|nr:chemotaxis protein CheB [Qipengyuania vesicularis]MBX7527369.1 PAS domain-containing protein [Qipengyuania vesicularis]